MEGFSAELLWYNFRPQSAVHFVATHSEIPVVAIGIYLVLIFLGPLALQNQNPLALRPLFKLWNLLLAAFSIAGAYHTIPTAVHYVTTKGLQWTLCQDPLEDSYYTAPSGFWFFAFGMSKIPELGDTLFLVAQKKKVIFLHWYHHITVLLYCWHSFHMRVGGAMYFATMNYFVHSIMYTYYLLMCYPSLRKYIRRIAVAITTLQIVQMLGGIFVTVATAYFLKKTNDAQEECHVNVLNLELCAAMYMSYLVLFAVLFKQMYLSKRPTGASKKKK